MAENNPEDHNPGYPEGSLFGPQPSDEPVVHPPKHEPRLPLETAQAIGNQQQETARAEIERRDDGAYSSPRLVRESIGGAALTTQDEDRQDVRRIQRNAGGQAPKKRTKRPYRARYKDTTDYVVRQLKPDEASPPTNPDEDIDQVFGVDEARRIL